MWRVFVKHIEFAGNLETRRHDNGRFLLSSRHNLRFVGQNDRRLGAIETGNGLLANNDSIDRQEMHAIPAKRGQIGERHFKRARNIEETTRKLYK